MNRSACSSMVAYCLLALTTSFACPHRVSMGLSSGARFGNQSNRILNWSAKLWDGKITAYAAQLQTNFQRIPSLQYKQIFKIKIMRKLFIILATLFTTTSALALNAVTKKDLQDILECKASDTVLHTTVTKVLDPSSPQPSIEGIKKLPTSEISILFYETDVPLAANGNSGTKLALGTGSLFLVTSADVKKLVKKLKLEPIEL